MIDDEEYLYEENSSEEEKSVNKQIHLLNHFIPPDLMRRNIDICPRKKRGANHTQKKIYKQTHGKFCYYCGTTTTTEWRRGPDKKNSLCNACGLKFTQNRKKESLIIPKEPRRIPITDLLN
eukprot:TRINITY_DN11602_c0_g1_i1.p1 TRINITY_DN11602_c0_g1~~TRINITY_DN11602_c0_g1_i1.p1  ORF type:complete len:121 (-),score=24.10 TRINITY_DN11602_c0_g1_i1:117-479(-)